MDKSAFVYRWLIIMKEEEYIGDNYGRYIMD